MKQTQYQEENPNLKVPNGRIMTGISKARDTKRGGEGGIAEREMRTWPRVPPPVLTH